MPSTWARVAAVLLLGAAGVQFLAFYSSIVTMAT